ncbi:hypothetical protein ACFE04_028726 [Oxalis oulophora]
MEEGRASLTHQEQLLVLQEQHAQQQNPHQHQLLLLQQLQKQQLQQNHAAAAAAVSTFPSNIGSQLGQTINFPPNPNPNLPKNQNLFQQNPDPIPNLFQQNPNLNFQQNPNSNLFQQNPNSNLFQQNPNLNFQQNPNSNLFQQNPTYNLFQQTSQKNPNLFQQSPNPNLKLQQQNYPNLFQQSPQQQNPDPNLRNSSWLQQQQNPNPNLRQQQQQQQLNPNLFQQTPNQQEQRQNPNLQQQQNLQEKAVNQADLQMAYQDAMRVCNPEIERPFSSLQDACERLIPYHVVSEVEAEEDDRILESDTTGQVLSRTQQWDNNITAKVAEFTSTFEKQVLAFNLINHKRATGELRSEERLTLEQLMLREEKNLMMEVHNKIKARERANREAHEARMRMAQAQAQAEQARAELMRAEQARAELMRGPIRAGAFGLQGSNVRVNPDGMMSGWGNNAGRDESESSEDFLNDNEDDGAQGGWHGPGNFDLNRR